jgi:3-phosphoshikimate 1-carboxyvinyltransferase
VTGRALIAEPVERVAGEITVPGDKSISHRSLLLGAIANGITEVSGLLTGADCVATLAALQAMGVNIRLSHDGQVTIEGVGLFGLDAPGEPLDMGNSGTAMRLLAGLLSAQRFDSILIGDESLSRRPMERIAAPLRLMGAKIETTGGHAPLRLHGNRSLRGIDYEMPVASAQVKSALLLAGLYATASTSVREPGPSRDHTERMLVQFGGQVQREGSRTVIDPVPRLQAAQIDVPGDLSSAAFLLLAGCLAKQGEVMISNVGLNPTRTGFLRVLQLMGANIEIRAEESETWEPTGAISARPSALQGIRLPVELVPLAIDEFPLIFIAAALAKGETEISGAAELRHKESDRIRVMVEGLRALGIEAQEHDDGARIVGGRLRAGVIDSAGDHRVAMAFAVAAGAAAGPIRVVDTQNIDTSFPGFLDCARSIGLRVSEQRGVG